MRTNCSCAAAAAALPTGEVTLGLLLPPLPATLLLSSEGETSACRLAAAATATALLLAAPGAGVPGAAGAALPVTEAGRPTPRLPA